MELLISRRHASWHFVILFSALLGLALACNFSPLTQEPPTSTPTAPSAAIPTATSTPTGELTPQPPTSPPPSSAPTDTPTPSPTPTPTISPCADNARGRTKGCDQFSPQEKVVSHFDSTAGAQTECQGWCQLKEGDSLETNDTGQAELNFSDCWPGRLFLFQASVAQTLVSACTKADFCPGGNCSNPPVVCVPNGALFADKCAGEFNPVTGSTRIEKNTASYMITYDINRGNVTTILVTDGVVRLRPVLSYDPLRLGEPMEVVAGEFMFTMPDENLQGVGGLEPRAVHSMEQLPQVVQELGLEDWVVQAAETAREGGHLPENWPRELSGRGLTATAGGGELKDQGLQLAIYRAINWSDLPVSDRLMRLVVDGKRINAFDISFEPASSAELLLSQNLVLRLVFPAGDDELAKTASVISEYLGNAGVTVQFVSVQPAQLAVRVMRIAERGQPYLLLTR